jgi:hypothetical protein
MLLVVVAAMNMKTMLMASVLMSFVMMLWCSGGCVLVLFFFN